MGSGQAVIFVPGSLLAHFVCQLHLCPTFALLSLKSLQLSSFESFEESTCKSNRMMFNLLAILCTPVVITQAQH